MKNFAKITSILAAAGFGLTVAAATVPANAAVVQAGILNCAIGPSVGFIVATPAQMTCTFYPSSGKPAENYTGIVTKAGVGAGIVAGTALSWAVFDLQDTFATKGLAGTYAGASGEMAMGLGLGVNVLFGGSNESLVLSPISIQGSVAVGGGVGVTLMQLTRV
ncbi:MAG: DUF992 domain-containing protein [Mesorhizobium sp.]|nr:DUF992 domain-containing protein [Mesorhizobium sp.]